MAQAATAAKPWEHERAKNKSPGRGDISSAGQAYVALPGLQKSTVSYPPGSRPGLLYAAPIGAELCVDASVWVMPAGLCCLGVLLFLIPWGRFLLAGQDAFEQTPQRALSLGLVLRRGHDHLQPPRFTDML